MLRYLVIWQRFILGFISSLVAGARRHPQRPCQVIGDIVGREAQVIDTCLDHLPPLPQPRQGQGWIRAVGDDQVHLGREMLEQERQGPVNGLGFDDVIFVGDQDQVVCKRSDSADEGVVRIDSTGWG